MKSNMTIIEDIEDYIKWIKSNELMSKEEKEDILGWIRREIMKLKLEASKALERIEKVETDKEEKLKEMGIDVPF